VNMLNVSARLECSKHLLDADHKEVMLAATLERLKQVSLKRAARVASCLLWVLCGAATVRYKLRVVVSMLPCLIGAVTIATRE
jgi:hypothetical protein